MKKIKVLCVCSRGSNRSKYLANYLRGKNYSTRYRGAEPEIYPEGIEHPLKQGDINWSDIIIAVRPRLKKVIKSKFKTKNKKIITINVTDSRRLIPKKFAHLKKLDHKTFQEKWTYPQLRKAINSYLPLKVD